MIIFLSFHAWFLSRLDLINQFAKKSIAFTIFSLRTFVVVLRFVVLDGLINFIIIVAVDKPQVFSVG